MLSFIPQCAVPEEIRARNIGLSKGKYSAPSGSGRLAVVGGGPSVSGRIEALRSWPGDIWAINGAAQWCIANGIRALLYSVDAGDDLAPLCVGVDAAVLADHCDPAGYEAMKEGAIYQVPSDMPGPTSAVASTVLAIKAGYDGVTFFGCESSYEGTTHVYSCEDVGSNLIRVACGGSEYLTKPELLLQAKQLADVIRQLPEHFSECSGGLLSAMIADTSYQIVGVSRSIYNSIQKVA